MYMNTNGGKKSLGIIAINCLIASQAWGGDVPIILETQKLIASDGMPSDKFGLALDRDGDTLIIGAPQHYTNSLPGSFYVFTRNQLGQWSEQTRIMSDFMPGEAEFGDLFGEALAVEDDTLLVGAPFTELNGTMLVGLVYVFTRDGAGTWVQQQTLLPGGPNITRFGASIVLQGDTAVIASLDRAFVFTRDDAGVWSQDAEIPNIDLEIVGPVAFDGQRIVVPIGSFSSGENRALLYSNDGNGWALTATIIPPLALFGRIADVSIENSRLALGMPDAAGEDRAYVYQESAPGSWAQQAMLNPNNLENDSFGMDVVLKGNLLLVGANHAGANGITYVYRRDASGSWSQQMQLMPSDDFPDNFGDEIDFDEGLPIIGSWAHHENGLYAGAVYVFSEIPLPVTGDITGDGLVNIDDLVQVITHWGPCPSPCPADVNGNGVVNIDDLVTVITAWTN